VTLSLKNKGKIKGSAENLIGKKSAETNALGNSTLYTH